MSGLKAWCSQGDDFDWMTEFLRQRGWLRAAQRIMMVVAGSASLVPLAVLSFQRHPTEADVAAAASAFWLIAFLNLSVSLGVRGMSRAIAMYAQRSEEDALTGLLNRRAFSETVGHRLARPARAHTHLAVVMVDIDNFKRINDTQDHAAGDDALRTVAGLLREQAPPGAVICRAGGEEYLIALTCMASDVKALAAQICTAIGVLSLDLTASIGTAIADLHLLSGSRGTGLLEELVTIADRAMYAAKRSCGNRVFHSATTQP